MITNQPGTAQFVVAAGVMAVMVGVFQRAMGLLRLGVLVNFVSHSVIVGFASGAGVLIAWATDVEGKPVEFFLTYLHAWENFYPDSEIFEAP